MNFRSSSRDEPEINLIAFIDVLLVILIFLMLSTTYSKFTEMQLRLPVADTEAHRDAPKEIIVSVSSHGAYTVNKAPVSGRSVEMLANALQEGVRTAGQNAVLIISADASVQHQAVITVMEAARRAGLSQITFATQSSAQAASQ